MFEAIDGFPSGVVAVRGVGRVTADDYRAVLMPRIGKAATGGRKVRLYLEFGDGFDGYAPSAMLADARLGISEFSAFERVAAVSDTDWIRRAVQLFGPIIPGEVRAFAVADIPAAREWIGS